MRLTINVSVSDVRFRSDSENSNPSGERSLRALSVSCSYIQYERSVGLFQP